MRSAAETLSRRVRHLRTERRLSMKALADLVHVDSTTISRIESGGGTTIATAELIADQLGVPFVSLFAPAGFTCQQCRARAGEMAGAGR